MNTSAGVPIHPWWGRSISLAICCFALAGLAGLMSTVTELGNRTNDTFFRIRNRFDQSTSVVAVYIDDAALSEQGRWPWSRTQLAQLIDRIAQSKPNAIGLDILLSEPSNDQEDRALAASLRSAGNVILPAKITTSPAGPLWIEPLPIFADAALGVGHVQAILDADGICRRLPLAEMTLHGPLLMMSQLLASAPHAPRPATSRPTATEVLQPRVVTIDYRGLASSSPPSHKPFPTVSAASLFRGDHYDFRGQTVLIGFAGTGLEDELLTPLSYSTPAPGVLIQANMVDTLMRSRDLKTAPPILQAMLLLALCLLGGAWMQHQNTFRVALWLTFSLISMFALAYLCFVLWGLQFDLGPALVADVLLVPLGQLQHILLIQRMIGNSLNNLQRQTEGLPLYLAGALVPQLINSEQAPPLKNSESRIALIAKTDQQIAIVSGFQQSLLEGMRDGIAVFDELGNPMFENHAWRSFLTQSGWEQAVVWPQLSRLLYPLGNGSSHHPSSLADAQQHTPRKIDNEVLVAGQLWRLSMVLLPEVAAVRKKLYMVISADLTPQMERDQARQQALQFIAHELRTPLVSLLGFAELLQHFPQRAQEAGAANVIQQESQRLIALTTMFLECLKLETALPVVVPEDTDIEVVLQKAAVLGEALCQASNKKLVVIKPEEPVRVHLDRAMMAGALLNLIANAVKYGADKTNVVIQVTVENGCAVLAVHNQGKRIPEHEFSRLFTPQYRMADNAAGHVGWGIGLAFVKRVLHAHGGSVRVTSDSSGTIFQLVLPLQHVSHEVHHA